jgi:hypothetical protein
MKKRKGEKEKERKHDHPSNIQLPSRNLDITSQNMRQKKPTQGSKADDIEYIMILAASPKRPARIRTLQSQQQKKKLETGEEWSVGRTATQ